MSPLDAQPAGVSLSGALSSASGSSDGESGSREHRLADGYLAARRGEISAALRVSAPVLAIGGVGVLVCAVVLRLGVGVLVVGGGLVAAAAVAAAGHHRRPLLAGALVVTTISAAVAVGSVLGPASLPLLRFAWLIGLLAVAPVLSYTPAYEAALLLVSAAAIGVLEALAWAPGGDGWRFLLFDVLALAVAGLTLASQGAVRRRLHQETEAGRSLDARWRRSEQRALLSRLSGLLAHELSQPLCGVTGFAALARDALPEEAPARQDLDVVLEQAQRMAKLLEHVQALSDDRASVRARFSLESVVRQAIELAAARARVLDVTLALGVPAPLPDVVGDPRRLELACLNILLNGVDAILAARKARGELAGRIEVELTCPPPGDRIHAQFRDNGTGMTSSVRRKALEPFFSAKQGHPGLGLVVARAVALDHGGRLSFRTRAGAGTLVKLQIPVAPADES